MANVIYFDLDGTVYPLYNLPNWLEEIHAKHASIFSHDCAVGNIAEIQRVCYELKAMGWKIGVITWAPKHVDVYDEFFDEVVQAKRDWVKKWLPMVDDDCFVVQAYGSFKGRATDCNSSGDKVLIDDNKICRAEWEEYYEGYYSIDANGDIVKELTGLLG